MTILFQISDCHLLKSKDKTGYKDIAPFHSLEAVLKAVQADVRKVHKLDGNKPVIVLVTGDISGDNSKESYHLFVSLMRQYIEAASVSWYAIAGNHDNNPYFDFMLDGHLLTAGTPLQIGSWLLHGCDTRHPNNLHGAVGKVKQEDVFAIANACEKSRLNNNPKNHLVALHHHIKPSNSWMDKHALEGAEQIEALASAQPGIKAVLHGHVHSPIRQSIGHYATPSFGCPSSCWQWAMEEAFGISNEDPGYQSIMLSDNGDITVDVRRVAYR